MEITVCDANNISRLARKPFEKKSALISMHGIWEERPYLYYKPFASLFLVFDDTFPSEAELLEFPPVLFSEQMAEEAAEFVYRVRGQADEIICQCECGVSRSAGMAAAIKEHFYGTGREILEAEAYSPNMYVYGLMLEALRKGGKKQPADG